MRSLSELPNIGKVLAARLEEVGIRNCEDLVAQGAIGAVLKVRGYKESGCYNMLYALEGAIRGCRWHSIPSKERDALRERFNRAVNELKKKELDEYT